MSMAGQNINELAACGAGDDVRKLNVKALEKAGITIAKIINEFKSIGFSNIKDYITIAGGGELQAIALDNISKRKTSAVKKIKEKTNIAESKDGETIFKRSTIEYELYDKVEVLKYLCRLRGDEPASKTELSGPNGQPIFSDLERANRLVYLAEQAKKRAGK